MDETMNFGLIGLGTMGGALALNIAEHGFPITVYNRTGEVTEHFTANAGELAQRLTPTATLEEFVAAIKPPRAIILMVPAGPVVDAQIDALAPLLGPGDVIIDAGNANYADTERRTCRAGDEEFDFIGIGVSGGEEGARHGPSIMVGGQPGHWQRLGHLFEAISAKYEGVPCAALMGQGGAGHFVKMVHNGIEYADMQMIAEAYSLMRDGMGQDSTRIARVFEQWNRGPLASYLIEISGKVARATDPITGAPMLDVIRDAAGQKGTGRWTAIEAQHLAVPVPVIEAAVAARNISARTDERAKGAEVFGQMPRALPEGALDLETLERALIAGKILCYAQGFEMLSVAAEKFFWDLPMATIARIWRAGCIIRSDMLNDMATALEGAEGESLIHAEPFRSLLQEHEAALRETVIAAMRTGIAVPALSSGLSWFDAMRTRRSSANIIQAQRDFFGAHSFQRLDGVDAPHGPWGDSPLAEG
ncbi:NADP-dependent phosphogluconate dehydrogenase [Paracoccus saliphilus]|uniref:6-phosphogluconate dehydrogenase, decarboxylating n=1 Tax=Paracoccus saliphilus TaxID=405559 RepID=A0AA45W7U5_9RHOB|nr:NADP-dependent phosphogluconate dehydrogenase [Paracoccus saliphilus]WCR01568.1 NADP-dependent phosphogluconate dehydrogenase [Paracoccus saliphilus]SIT12343.1 6-phosphogluconate dehydrogenase [Paracoccus saliphilus]